MTSIAGPANKELALLAIRLKAAGDGGLRRELLAGLRAGVRPVIPALQAAARADLPKGGGLNEWVAASKFSVRNRLSPFTAGVQIVNQSKTGTSRRGGSGSVQFGSDRGVVRHPVFGHKDRRWTETKVRGGWFTDTVEQHLPQITAEVTAVLTGVAERLTQP
jgi:hypothetical protein